MSGCVRDALVDVLVADEFSSAADVVAEVGARLGELQAERILIPEPLTSSVSRKDFPRPSDHFSNSFSAPRDAVGVLSERYHHDAVIDEGDHFDATFLENAGEGERTTQLRRPPQQLKCASLLETIKRRQQAYVLDTLLRPTGAAILSGTPTNRERPSTFQGTLSTRSFLGINTRVSHVKNDVAK